jgi:PAS domain S-box-containing protein
MQSAWPARRYTYTLVVALAAPLAAAAILLLLDHDRTAFALLVVAVVAALGTAIALSRRIAEPVLRISAVANRVAAGDRSVRAEPEGPLEIAEIARQMNRMLDELELNERALRRSEARYRALYETSNDAIVGIDLEGRIKFANDATERMLGYPPSEVVGRDVTVLMPPQLHDRYRRALRQLVEAKSAAARTTVETLAQHRDGREIAVEFTYSHLQAGGEELLVGILRDITERRSAMDRLRESEARFRAMADSAPAFIWLADAAQHCIYVNRAWLAFTGRSLEEEQGDGWLDCLHPADRERVRTANAEALVEQRYFAIEFRLRRHDGEYHWVLHHGAPRLDAAGTLVGYIGTAMDIDDRVQAGERVRRLTMLYAALSQANEALLRSREPEELFQRVCDVVVQHGLRLATVALVDGDGRHLRYVARAGDRLDLLDDAPIALDGIDPGANAPAVVALRSRAPVVNNDRTSGAAAMAQPGAPHAARLRASASFPLSRHGEPIGAFDVFADEVDFFDAEMTRLLELLANDVSYALDTLSAQAIREQAEIAVRQINATLEARVEERTRALEVANRELEAFGYSVSHDLRAPLRAITGFTDLVIEQAGDKLDAQVMAHLARVKAAAARMSQLINDLLDLSRIARAEFNRRDTSLSAMVTEIVVDLYEADPKRRVDVKIAQDLRAHADPGLVRVLLANLIGNAWKFTAKCERATIEFGAQQFDGADAFFVRDNGAGFDVEHADKLFAPFQRLHSDREFPGTGIGLAIAQRVVHRHGGRIWARAAVNSGATFYFTLPTQ